LSVSNLYFFDYFAGCEVGPPAWWRVSHRQGDQPLRVAVITANAGVLSLAVLLSLSVLRSLFVFQYLQCKELILRESIRLGGLSREGVLRMVKVELHQNYGSVYDFAVSRSVPRLNSLHYIPLLTAFISGWVKRTIDPVVSPPVPSVTSSAVTDTDSLGAAIGSSLKIESDLAAAGKDAASAAVSASGKGASDAGAM
jgi:hypothetical protein